MPAISLRTRKRLIALGASLALCLLAAEIAVRVAVGAPLAERMPLMKMRANPVRGWQMVPGQTHYTYQHRVNVNALGLRGPEIGEKGENERRVLYLGDSLVYGQGVADDETQPAVLERELRARDPKVAWTVVNAGHRSYDTAQELALLEELGGRIRPDVVLLGWYWNDIDERDIARTYENLQGKGELYFDTNNTLEGLDLLAWRGKQLCRRSALVMLVHDLVVSKGRPYTEDYLELVWQRMDRHLGRFGELCAQLGARAVVVLVPDAHRIGGGGGETRAFDERLSALASARALPLIELLPPLEVLHARTHRVPIVPFDGHYDAEGNRVMAEHLAERLLALDLVRSE